MTHGYDWVQVSNTLPEPKVTVQTESPGGIVQELYYERGLWFDPDSGVHVYYTPVRWRPARG